MIFEVAELGYKELLRWLSINGADFSAHDEEGRGIYECLLDGLDQELMEPSTEERAIAYWQLREETIRFLTENIPSISMTSEQRMLFSALRKRGGQ